MATTDTPITGETWGDEVDSVRAYLLAESERPFAEIRPVVAAERERLRALCAGTTAEQVAFRPDSGEGEDAWGIAEVLRHVASVEVIFAERIRQLGLGQPVDVTKTYPGFMESLETRDRDELLAAFEASGRVMLEAVDAIEGSEVLDSFDTHRLFGELNCRGWFRLHGIHMMDHAHQVAKMKTRSGYPEA